jgi:hypothetical protein
MHAQYLSLSCLIYLEVVLVQTDTKQIIISQSYGGQEF